MLRETLASLSSIDTKAAVICKDLKWLILPLPSLFAAIFFHRCRSNPAAQRHAKGGAPFYILHTGLHADLHVATIDE